MLRIIARSIDGVEIPFQMLQTHDEFAQPQIPEQMLQTRNTLAQSQRALLTRFQKPFRSTWADVVIDNVSYNKPESQPFVDVREGMAIQVCFRQARSRLRVRLAFDESTIHVAVNRTARLSELRAFLSVLQPARWTWQIKPILICPQQDAVFDSFHDLLIRMCLKQDETKDAFCRCQSIMATCYLTDL